VAAIFVSTPVLAQVAGAPMSRDKVAKELLEKHGEKPTQLGIADNGGVLELFTTKSGSTWTLILTMPNGRSFLVGSGKHWMKDNPKPEKTRLEI